MAEKKEKESTEESKPKAGKLPFICRDCEWCHHDINGKPPKPGCIHPKNENVIKPIGDLEAVPGDCPRRDDPIAVPDTGIELPNTCGDCQFVFVPDAEGQVKQAGQPKKISCLYGEKPKEIQDVKKREAGCPLAKSAKVE